MAIILYDVVLPKLVGVQICYNPNPTVYAFCFYSFQEIETIRRCVLYTLQTVQ